jgi:hypothetical protein
MFSTSPDSAKVCDQIRACGGAHPIHEISCTYWKIFGTVALREDLFIWIKAWWNPKGHFDLQLGSKGFFTMIFHNLEDQDRVFENGPYFFNSASFI